jgi:hypothetical protein
VLDLLAQLSVDDTVVLLAVVGLRLAVPLLIPRIPLVIVAALLVDAADQTILATFTEIDTGETGPYQSYDKALDVYYLTIAYLSTIRNWSSEAAFRVGQFLFFYRLVGTTLFELTDERLLLLVFPNTFEYFFIVYEVVRLRYEPSRFSARFWILTAGFLWVFVKLPQEYWIHVAELDFTDAVRNHPAFGVACVLAVLGLLAVALFVIRPRLPVPDWAYQFVPDSAAPELGTPDARFRSRLGRGILSIELVEQAVLLTLVCVIFADILPGATATPLQIAIGVTAILLVNTAVSLWVARRGGIDFRSGATLFTLRLALNFVLVLAPSVLGSEAIPVGHGLFFAYLLTLVTWLYDWYRPLYEARFRR